MYSSGEVDQVGKFRIALLNDYGRGNQFREVVHGKFRKDFLVDVLHLFCVEVDEAKGVFELTEGSFNSPSSGVEEYKLGGWESVSRQIGNDGFKGICRKPEPNDTERKPIERKRIVLAVGGREKIEGRG